MAARNQGRNHSSGSSLTEARAKPTAAPTRSADNLPVERIVEPTPCRLELIRLQLIEQPRRAAPSARHKASVGACPSRVGDGQSTINPSVLDCFAWALAV